MTNNYKILEQVMQNMQHKYVTKGGYKNRDHLKRCLGIYANINTHLAKMLRMQQHAL